MTTVTVASYDDIVTANLAVNYLRQHKIKCFLADQYTANVYLSAPIKSRIIVDEKDLNRATAILDKLEL